MNNNRLLIIVLALLAFCGSTALAVQNPSVSNPAGVTTTPQSYLRSGLVDTSGTLDNSGNQIVTGNVRRGAHFRGNVPYNSPSSFSSTLGSSSLSSFMRDSAGAEDFGSYQGTTVRSTTGTSYQPYNLPSSTVTSMSPNGSGLTTQLNTKANTGSQYVSGSQRQQSYASTAENQPSVYSQGTSGQNPTLWQLYNSGLAGVQSQIDTSSEPPQLYSSPRVNEQHQQEQNTNQNRWSNPSLSESNTSKQSETPQYNMQQSQGQTNQWQTESTVTTNQTVPTYTQQHIPSISESAATGMQNPPTAYRPANTEVSSGQRTAYKLNAERYTLKADHQGQDTQNTAQDTKTTEAIANIQRQLDDLIRSIDTRLESPADYTSQYSTTVQDAVTPQTGISYQRGQGSRDFSVQSSSRLHELIDSSDGSQMQSSQSNTSTPASLSRMSQEQIHTQAKQIMGQHTDYPSAVSSGPNYETYSQSKYDQLCRAAEGHLGIGRFYQAADAYTLAAIYNPDDPLCYAGRGHALFAAGEYVNSALHLIRAIEIDPEYVNTKIDLAELLGGPEDLDKRIVELNKWLQKSNAPGLGFLLGYVYYRQGRFNEARMVMDVVMQEMPQSRATIALKMAIDFKLQTQK